MTNIPRLYVTEPPIRGASVRLDDGQAKYLTRVMRMGQGEIVRAFDGVNGEWKCALEVGGKAVSLALLEQTREQVALTPLRLLFAPLKKTRTDFVVEKATELGVTHIQPIVTEYTQTGRVRADRLTALAIEAAEQTERLDVPDVSDALALVKALDGWPTSVPLYYCDEGSEARPMADVLSDSPQKEAALLVGPEGGFSPRERKMLRALAFVIPVTLGPRILRAETAALSALTLWQSQVGDWRERPYVPET